METNSFGSLIADAKKLLAQTVKWLIRHVKREINMVTHHLAKDAVTKLQEIIDISYVDQYMNSVVVLADC